LAISRRLVEAMGGEIGLESQRRVGSTFWFDLSIRCTLAEDGPSALATLQAIPDSEIPSLVILDMQMPGMDGLAVAQMLKRDPRTAGMKVILATSLSEVRALEGDSPIDIRLAKPIRQAALHRAIAGLLQPREEARPESAARREPEAIEGEGVSARVLLVEDNPVNQMVAQAMLGQLRHEVEVARNGQEALDALGRSKYDVILMDCQMPVMDGFEATRAIRALDGDVNRIPIVAMTANAMKEDRQRCLDAGMNDYLAKPVSVRDLASVIGRALEGDRTAL
jgi:CheY-like chemotaxis protein